MPACGKLSLSSDGADEAATGALRSGAHPGSFRSDRCAHDRRAPVRSTCAPHQGSNTMESAFQTAALMRADQGDERARTQESSRSPVYNPESRGGVQNRAGGSDRFRWSRDGELLTRTNDGGCKKHLHISAVLPRVWSIARGPTPGGTCSVQLLLAVPQQQWLHDFGNRLK